MRTTLLPALLAALLFVPACAPRARPRPSPLAGVVVPPAAGAAAASLARSLVGVPYRNGGSDSTGFDCSGLVQYVYARAGVSLPRSVREQMRVGTAVPPDQVVTGDLLFFAIDGRTVSHVGIAVGPDRFVHAPSARGVVREERSSADYWRRRFSAARRPSSVP